MFRAALYREGKRSRVKRWLQLRFDCDSAAIILRYNHSTTYVTTAGCCTAA